MSEPKKETVRIVLPPRRDGQPAASGARETAMINLPPKPVPKPADPASAGPEGPAISAVPKPPSVPSLAPKVLPSVGFSPPPAAPKPPSIAGGAPKPPVLPVAPKPPSVIGGPRPPAASPPPVSVPPSAPKAPSVATVPSAGLASVEGKKETAKVPPSVATTRPNLPQASVHLQRRPGSSTSSSAITVAPPVQSEGGAGLMVGILALVASLVAVGVQVWMFL
jgi:hypothetical protein